MRRGFGAVGGAVVLCFAALTSACTTSTTPPAESSSTAAASSTMTSPATPPSSTSSASATTASGIPEAARANTPAGAEAFTRYFGEVLDESFATLSVVKLTPLVLSECKSCTGAIDAIAGYRSRQERYDGKYAAFTSAIFSNSENRITKVLAHSETSGAKVIDSQGSVIKTIPKQSGNLSVQLRYDGQWRVAEVQGVT